MSSTCNVAGCRNDTRYPTSQIWMPHINDKLRFHKPKEADLPKWQAALQRENYLVTTSTRVCSNHFRNGCPLNQVPSLYIRGYPKWARSRDSLKRAAAAVCPPVAKAVLDFVRTNVDKITLQIIDSDINFCEEKPSLDMLLELFNSCVIDRITPNLQKGLARFIDGEFFNDSTFTTPKRKRRAVSPSSPRQKRQKPDELNLSCHSYADIQMEEPNIDDIQQQNRNLSQANSNLLQMIKELQAQLTEKDSEISRLHAENEFLQRRRLSSKDLENNDDKTSLFTGLPTYSTFQWLTKELRPAAERMTYWEGKNTTEKDFLEGKPRKRQLSIEDELLMTLLKLRQNTNSEILAFLFDISPSYVSRIITTYVALMFHQLEGLLHFPTLEQNRTVYPSCFKYWDNVVSIIDCFEIFCEKPSSTETNAKILSNYKNHATMKFLISITAGGSISFVSEGFGGNTSDDEIVEKSGILDLFKPGDQGMADKGFRKTKALMLERGAMLLHPHFTRKGKQFTIRQNYQNGRNVVPLK